MKIIKDPEIDEIADALLEGQIAVIRTDTLYGLVACADNMAAVEKVFTAKSRPIDKQCIVLVASAAQMWDEVSEEAYNAVASQLSESPTSVIVPVGTDTPQWIHRGGQDVAFRMPNDMFLHELLLRTGPLVAPSANPDSQEPARSINQAVDYFGESVDLYVDGGYVENTTPSQLVRVDTQGELERLR